MRSTGPAFNALVFSTENCTELHAPRFNSGCTQFSPDSQQVIFCVDGAALILRASDGKELVRRPLAGHLAISSALASSANGILTALAITPQFMQLCRSGDLSPIISLTSPLPGNVRSCRIAQDGSRLATLYTGNKIILWDVRALRHQLGLIGLDWCDSATTPQVVGSPVAVSTVSRWGLAFWLFAAAIVAAVTSVLLLRRQHQLMRDFAEAEALLDTQRRDLEQANSSLLHSQKMKALGTLAAGMAHDFNNMLSVIRMSNKLIARETRGNTEVTELVASVESAVLQGKQVVRSMLSYSRAEDDDAPHRPIAVVVQDAAALFSTEFLSGITLKMSLDERAPEVDVSNSSIQQILLNLIVNASEAMKGTGSLTITVRRATALDTAICVLPPQRAAEYVEICVTDTGPGIPNDIAERIFEPFFTTKNAGNDRGTGLGLSMVYTIAEREGMGLALRSIVGQGAAFYLFLPVCTVRESHTEIHTSTA
jgi:signal transduction histidine kinase